MNNLGRKAILAVEELISMKFSNYANLVARSTKTFNT